MTKEEVYIRCVLDALEVKDRIQTEILNVVNVLITLVRAPQFAIETHVFIDVSLADQYGKFSPASKNVGVVFGVLDSCSCGLAADLISGMVEAAILQLKEDIAAGRFLKVAESRAWELRDVS